MELISSYLQYIEVEIDKLIELNDDLGKISIATDIMAEDKYYKVAGTDVSTLKKKDNWKKKGVKTLNINITEKVVKHLIDKYPERYADKYVDTRVVDIEPSEVKPGLFLRQDAVDAGGKVLVKKWKKITSAETTLIKNQAANLFLEVFIWKEAEFFGEDIAIKEETKAKPKVFLVDDQIYVTDSLQMALSDYGFNVFTLNDPENVIHQMRRIKPDIMMLDINMPDFNGFEVLQEISKFEYLKNIPVIMLTARAQKQDIVKAIELGASDYLKKPIDLKKILEKFKKFLPAEKITTEVISELKGDEEIAKEVSSDKIEELLSQI